MQYPYKLYKKTIIGSGEDEDGNAVGGVENDVFVSECRDERSSGKRMNGLDGAYHDYTAKIHLPLTTPDIALSEVISVKDSLGSVRLTGQVIMFDRGQYHCRIWV